MHIITILREYLGETQLSLSRRAGITQADLCEMEKLPPFGSVEKYARVAKALDVPIHTLVCNNFAGVPEQFFETHHMALFID